jgi:hypothetical protein
MFSSPSQTGPGGRSGFQALGEALEHQRMSLEIGPGGEMEEAEYRVGMKRQRTAPVSESAVQLGGPWPHAGGLLNQAAGLHVPQSPGAGQQLQLLQLQQLQQLQPYSLTGEH